MSRYLLDWDRVPAALWVRECPYGPSGRFLMAVEPMVTLYGVSGRAVGVPVVLAEKRADMPDLQSCGAIRGVAGWTAFD